MAFEKLRTNVMTAIPKPRSRERFRKVAEAYLRLADQKHLRAEKRVARPRGNHFRMLEPNGAPGLVGAVAHPQQTNAQ